MNKILIIGCNEITRAIVPILCADNMRVDEVCIASKSKEECDEIKRAHKDLPVKIVTAGVDVSIEERALLMMRIFGPTLIVNLAPTWLNKQIMDIALKIGASYIDCAYYTDQTGRNCLIDEQFALASNFDAIRKTAVTGCSFDFAVYVCLARLAAKMSDIGTPKSIDIIDLEFDKEERTSESIPSIDDLRRLSEPLRYIRDGEFYTSPALSVSAHMDIEGVGDVELHMFDNSILDSFHRGMPEVKDIRYFSQVKEEYKTTAKILDSLGMLGKEPIDVGTASIAPVDYLASVIPHAKRNEDHKDIQILKGIIVEGSASDKKVLLGVRFDGSRVPPDMKVSTEEYIKAMTLLSGIMCIDQMKWNTPGVFTPGDFDPQILLDNMRDFGLRYEIKEDIKPLQGVL